MKVLGISTATDVCGVAIIEEDHLLCEYALRTDSLHAEHLLVLVDRVLKDVNLTLKDLDGYALTIGPGSFTGLRVALSTVKGWVTGSPKPVLAISTLKALALTLPMVSLPICPMLDARREKVSAALFCIEESGEMKRLMEDQIIFPHDLLEHISGSTIFLGDGALRYRGVIIGQLGRHARFPLAGQGTSIASAVALEGLRHLRQGHQVEIDTLSPMYLRQTEAERSLERRLE